MYALVQDGGREECREERLHRVGQRGGGGGEGLLGEAHGPGGGPHDEDAIPTGGEGEATQGLSGGGGEP